MTWKSPADRGNKMAREKGFGQWSRGAAGPVTVVDRDTVAVIGGLLARGMHPERVATQTGAGLRLIRMVAEANR